MASRMRIWLGVVVGGILLITVWGFPPQSYEDWRGGSSGGGRDWLPERVAYDRVRKQVARENWLYQRLQWRDSVAALARDARSKGRVWSAVLPDSAPEHFRRGLEAAVSAQLAAEEIREPRVPVGVVLMEGRTGAHPSAPPGNYGFPFDLEVYVGRDPRASYCYLLRPVYGVSPDLENIWSRLVWAPADGSAPPSPLGPCMLHAKYGRPGTRVLEWLAGRGYAMAIGRRNGAPKLNPQPMEGRALPTLGRRTLWGEGMPEAEACFAGRLDGCRKALHPESASDRGAGRWQMEAVTDSRSLISRIPEYGYYLPFGGREFGLLWDLEEDFGPERFQAFWSSELEVEEAFRAAFDTGFPEWVMAWGQERFGVSRVGAIPPLQATVLSLLTIGVLAATAIFRGRPRR